MTGNAPNIASGNYASSVEHVPAYSPPPYPDDESEFGLGPDSECPNAPLSPLASARHSAQR